MYEPVPPKAERLCFSCVHKTVRRPSRFVPGVMAFAEEFVCPVCATTEEPLQEGVTRSCKCGLHFQMRALQVYAWAPLGVQS